MDSGLKVVLISANSSRFHPGKIVRGKRSLGLVTIKQALAERAMAKVALFPATSEHSISDLTGCSLFWRELGREVADTKENNLVFFLSSTAQDYRRLITIARGLRDHYPRSKIIAGGPLFKEEHLVYRMRKMRSPVEVVLAEDHRGGGLFDGANVGHCGGAIDWLSAFNGEVDIFNKTSLPPSGLYLRTAREQIIGHGWGRYPKLGSVPYTDGEAENTADILVSDSCSHSCGFCSVNPHSLGFSREVVVNSLKTLFAGENMLSVDFLDSNPFEPGGRLLPALNETESGRARICKFGFIEPSLLCGQRGLDLVLQLYRHGFIRFFIGRDVVTAESAEIIGSNYHGKPKEQAALDEEREAVRNFIVRFTAILKGSRQSSALKIGYLLSPFDSMESLEKTVAEMETFKRLSNDHVVVQPTVELACPYPGTRFRKKFIDYLLDPENYFLLSASGFRVWDEARIGETGRQVIDLFRRKRAPLAS